MSEQIQFSQAITDIDVIVGDSGDVEPKHHFLKIPVDVNEGAGGKYIYLCYQRSSDGQPGTGITVLEGKGATPPAGWQMNPTDLNQGAGGSYLYIAWTHQRGVPVLDLVVQSADHEPSVPQDYRGRMYTRNPTDLNKGAGGKYIYLSYLQHDPDPAMPDLNSPDVAKRYIPLPGHEHTEWEYGRAQLTPYAMCVRTFSYSLDKAFNQAPHTPETITVTTHEGAENSAVTTFGLEIGVTAGASYGGVEAAINTKMAYSTSQSFTLDKWTDITRTVNLPDSPDSQRFVWGTLCDTVRLFSLTNPNTPIAELTQRTDVHFDYTQKLPGIADLVAPRAAGDDQYTTTPA